MKTKEIKIQAILPSIEEATKAHEEEANMPVEHEPLMVAIKTNDMAEEISMIEEKNHKEDAEVVVATGVASTNTKDTIVILTKSLKLLNLRFIVAVIADRGEVDVVAENQEAEMTSM